MINRVTLIGRLGKDPEIRNLEGGSTVARFSLATSESYMDKQTNNWIEQTEWHNIVLWRDLAKRAEQSLRKGYLIFLEGKITYRQWKDQDGKDRYSTEIVANSFRVINKSEQHSDSNAAETQPAHAPAFQPSMPQPQDNGDGDDLPF